MWGYTFSIYLARWCYLGPVYLRKHKYKTMTCAVSFEFMDSVSTIIKQLNHTSAKW